MNTLLLTTPQPKLKANAFSELKRQKLSGWRVKAVPSGSIDVALATAPDVTLVQLSNETVPSEIKAIVPRLVHIQSKSPNRSYVLFSIKKQGGMKLQQVRAKQKQLHKVIMQINRELPTFPNPLLVDVSFAQTADSLAVKLDHIRAKLKLPDLESKASKSLAPRRSPLDQVQEFVEATGDLRVESGNLSAAAVAKAFGVSLNQLAGWLGRKRQTLHKTPDADSLQNQLAFFERVARVRAVVPDEGFQKWLRMPNAELDNKKPLELLATGERQVVADLVDDMLSGAPT